jgi:flagellar biosynthesis protein FlhF
MNIQTFRADNMHEALQQVRRELGPDAAVLRTREVRGGLMRWLLGKSQVEICATGEMATAGRAAATRPVQSAKSVTERPRPAVRERLPLGEVGLDLAALAGATAGLSSSAELPATSNLTRTGGQATRGTQFETIGGPFDRTAGIGLPIALGQLA